MLLIGFHLQVNVISSANLKKVNTMQLASSMNAASLTLKMVNMQCQLLTASADQTSATVTVKIVVNIVARKSPPPLML